LLLAVLMYGASETMPVSEYAPVALSIDDLDAGYFHAEGAYLILENLPRGPQYVSAPDYAHQKDHVKKRGDFQEIFFDVERTPAFAERVLSLSRVVVNERFLREKGMTSVTLNQGIFASRSAPVAAEFLNFHTSLTDTSRLHTQIVQRK
jgi:hypothetical protein